MKRYIFSLFFLSALIIGLYLCLGVDLALYSHTSKRLGYKLCLYFIEKAVEKKALLDKSVFFVREYAVEKVCA